MNFRCLRDRLEVDFWHFAVSCDALNYKRKTMLPYVESGSRDSEYAGISEMTNDNDYFFLVSNSDLRAKC